MVEFHERCEISSVCIGFCKLSNCFYSKSQTFVIGAETNRSILQKYYSQTVFLQLVYEILMMHNSELS